MAFHANILNDDEKKRVHQASIKILEEVGVKYPSERALSLLEKNGAKIDWDRQIAYLSGGMVNDALNKAPKEYVLGARNSAYDLKMPAPDSVYNLDGAGMYTYDYDLGKRRGCLTGDIEKAARIFDEIEIGNVIWAPVQPSGVPAGSESIVGLAALLKNCCKHAQDEMKDKREVELVINMLKAVLGSVDEVIKRKIYSVCYCTIAPLSNELDMMEATLDLCKYHVPILAFPMPAAGSTGPASLFSNLAMANAETLSIFVLFQCEKPGIPIIFGAAQGATNRRSGVFLEGAVETSLQLMASQEMGIYYGFPTEIAGCITDAKEPGIQASLEKMTTSLPMELAGADVIQGLGLLESSMTLSLEQMLIDEELVLMNKRIKAGINISNETDFFEDIKTVGPGGHFLSRKNTKATFRSKEFYHPSLADRDSYEEWLAKGSPDMYKNAHKRVEEILSSDFKNPLSANVEKEIDEIVEESIRLFGGD